MINSGFQDMSDLIRLDSGSNKDSLGRKFPTGTIMDPATTRNLRCGEIDAVTGLSGPACTGSAAPGTIVGTVRDPFYTGNVGGVTDYTTVPVANLDHLPAGRIDPNAVKLLGLYPAQTRAGFINNWVAPRTYDLTINQYDLRVDSTLNQNNIIWGVWDVYDALEIQPGILPGFAQGANYGAGSDWSPHWALAGGYTHIFSPTMTNAFRVGGQNAQDYNTPTYGAQAGIPAQFGIQGVPGGPGLGGLPNITLTNMVAGRERLQPGEPLHPQLGDRQVFTKIHGNHTFNMGYQLTDILAHLRQPTAGSGSWLIAVSSRISRPTTRATRQWQTCFWRPQGRFLPASATMRADQNRSCFPRRTSSTTRDGITRHSSRTTGRSRPS